MFYKINCVVSNMSFVFHEPFAVIDTSNKIRKRDVIIWSVIINKPENVIVLLKEGLKEDTKGSCICKYVYLLLVLTVQNKSEAQSDSK